MNIAPLFLITLLKYRSYVKFVWHNPKISYCSHVCNCWNIQYFMHNVYECLRSISTQNCICFKRVISFRHEMQPPLCFTSHKKKKFFDRSYVFFDDLLPYFISRFQINCSSPLRSSHARVTDLQWHNVLIQARRNRTLGSKGDRGNTESKVVSKNLRSVSRKRVGSKFTTQ
jgi:hypothetical protein